MAQTLTCPNCQNRFRLPADHVGARVPCPRCEHLVAVPGEAGAEEITEEKPAPRKAVRRPVRAADVERDEDVPPIRQSDFEPCPRCGAEDPKRVKWTPWGSFYGPMLFNHVRCRKCQYAYNGRTGGSNLIWAIIFVTIPLVLIVGIIVGMVWFVILPRL